MSPQARWLYYQRLFIASPLLVRRGTVYLPRQRPLMADRVIRSDQGSPGLDTWPDSVLQGAVRIPPLSAHPHSLSPLAYMCCQLIHTFRKEFNQSVVNSRATV